MKRVLSLKRKSFVLGAVVAISLLTGCRGEADEVNPLDVDAPLSINTALLYSEQHSSYDDKAESRRQEILNTEDTIQPSESGTTYYISYKGDDNNDGKSQETAWRSAANIGIKGSDIKEGDVVLFERGGLYRGYFILTSGVSYGAYGEGCKPTIYGSLRDYAYPELWEKTDVENVWKMDVEGLTDIGNIVFDHGVKCGMKILDDKLHSDGDFYHDVDEGILYLYMKDGNPGDLYYDIEICTNDHIMEGLSNTHDIKIENLCLKYTGAHGICFRGGSKNITVTGCEIGYIGGSMLNGMNVRYGNGFEVVDNCENIVVRDCWIYECFDAGVTHQSSYEPGCVQKDIDFSDNLIEYCSYNIEYYVSQTNGRMENITYANNILRFAGYGFGSINRIGGNTSVIANICNYVRTMPSENFVIKDNVMDSPLYYQMTVGYPNDPEKASGPEVFNNTYIQKEDLVAIYKIGGSIQKTLYAKSLDELEESISRIDSAPASIKFEKDSEGEE